MEGKVPPTEVEGLPKRYVTRGYDAAGKELLAHRLFLKALKLFNRQRAGSSIPPASKLADWEIETLFATASWERLSFTEPKVKTQQSEMAFSAIARAVYPVQLVYPELLQNFPLGVLLEGARDKGKYFQAAMRAVDGPETVRRLVISMIYTVARGEEDRELSEAIERISRSRNVPKRQPLAPVTERRLALLELAMTGESLVPVSINTLRLASGWLRDFQTYVDRGRYVTKDAAKLKELVADLGQVLTGPATTLQTLLGAIDSLAKEEGVKRAATLKVTAANTDLTEALKYLRGPSPEFRDPCRFALLEAFPNRASLRKLGEIFASILDLESQDLQPDSFVDIIAANPEQALVPYVEFVDRCWALGDLLKQAHSEVPSRKLEMVSSAFTRWEEALAATINRGLTPSFK